MRIASHPRKKRGVKANNSFLYPGFWENRQLKVTHYAWLSPLSWVWSTAGNRA